MNKLAITLIISGACTMLTSCAAPTIHYTDRTFRHTDVPPKDNVVTAEIGTELLTQKDVFVGLAVIVKDAPKNGWDFSGAYHIADKGTFYCGPLYNANDGNSIKPGYVCRTAAEFNALKLTYEEVDHSFADSSKNFKKVLEYSGKTGNSISLFYKEFNETSDGAFIRTAFTQEFKFDLNESKVIGIKGARIEVIKATNTGITYKILSHFPR